MAHNRPGKNSPLIAAAALVGAGIVLRSLKPTEFELPGSEDVPHTDKGHKKRARQARDGLAKFLPSNIFESLSNPLFFVAAALVTLRALDEVVEDREKLFD